jgi:hypothetical protein
VALWLAARNLPAALLLAFPRLMRVRETDDDGSLDAAVEPSMERVDEALRSLGFVKLGAIELCPPLSRTLPELVYGAPALHTFADLNARGGSLQVTLFTPFEGGEAVLTSNFRRSGRDDPMLLIGGLPGHDVFELWAVHRRRVARLVEGPRRAVPWGDVSLEGRQRAAERFATGVGKRELRARGLVPVMILAMSLALMVYAGVQLVGQLASNPFRR